MNKLKEKLTDNIVLVIVATVFSGSMLFSNGDKNVHLDISKLVDKIVAVKIKEETQQVEIDTLKNEMMELKADIKELSQKIDRLYYNLNGHK